ncbi:hypothetical protein [Pseudobutyrivibrio ruminis]|uniref:Uncharacterized protein n=1 Tax=Pseudobutyrivibrio ruminis DSM 9787 TaxID=1123011 RepID=A0A285SLZ0_9FIRM|nr:hypothetical protein [Pseudobutyrivibrio ruminis]SOC08428.1 hypothetical protein SAMN02910411_2484 [Pseudobutyrivibrio ruminis DSM 9787]
MEYSSYRNRIIAVVALAATLFMMLFSSMYLTAHASHHCEDSSHCPVCAMMVQCERSLKTLGTGLAVTVVVLFTFMLYTNLFQGYSFKSVQTTLISQKVRMDS